MLLGDALRFDETLRDSEDSSKLNTSFVERLNLTIRQGSALSFSADDLPRAMAEASQRSPGVTSLLLQLREASESAEIRMRSQDASYASWADHPTANVKGDLPAGGASLVVGESQVRTIDRLGRC